MFTTKDAYAIAADSDAEMALREALRDYARKSEDLMKKVESVRHVADRVERYLADDYNVNSLGELQSTATDFDRLCTERQAAAENVNRLAWTLQRVGALSESVIEAMLADTPFAK